MARRVLLYELNEVPWEIIDLFVAARPRSNLARLLEDSDQLTSTDADPVDLLPWRTWPTLHYSSYTDDHGSFDQGQDPATFSGTPLWEAADRAGRRVGVFAPLQSWPAQPLRSGGFYVPDTFARTPETIPPSLERFQAFNLRMTSDNAFAADSQLRVADLAKVGIDAVTKGLTAWSIVQATRHLVRERRDHRYMAGRPAVQGLPCFDIFWRLHRRHRPDLSIFFTNHVASMMHRFWGDWVPGYAAEHDYAADPVYRTFIPQAMDYVDHHIGRMRRWADAHPDALIVLASSMGQGSIPYHDMVATYVIDDTAKLVHSLGLHDGEVGLAMYPRLTVQFPTPTAAEAAVSAIRSVRAGDTLLFGDIRLVGTTLSCEIDPQFDISDLAEAASWAPFAGQARTGTIGDLGISVRSRPGGGNTAQHTPEGMLIAYGAGVGAERHRDKVDVLDVAPSLLALLEVETPPEMQGHKTLADRWKRR